MPANFSLDFFRNRTRNHNRNPFPNLTSKNQKDYDYEYDYEWECSLILGLVSRIEYRRREGRTASNSSSAERDVGFGLSRPLILPAEYQSLLIPIHISSPMLVRNFKTVDMMHPIGIPAVAGCGNDRILAHSSFLVMRRC